MAADINTSIVVNGTKEQLVAFYEALKSLFEEKRQRYSEKRDCYYLQSLSIGTQPDLSTKISVTISPQDKIDELLSKLTDTLYVDMMGPYGRFWGITRINLFEILAEAVPDCAFQGFIGGFDAGGDLALSAELKDGLLNLKYMENHEDWRDEDEDWDEDEPEEIEWDEEKTYDPVAKKYLNN